MKIGNFNNKPNKVLGGSWNVVPKIGYFFSIDLKKINNRLVGYQ
jgi:hypothetical protein